MATLSHNNLMNARWPHMSGKCVLAQKGYISGNYAQLYLTDDGRYSVIAYDSALNTLTEPIPVATRPEGYQVINALIGSCR